MNQDDIEARRARTAPAIAARMRKSEERTAAKLAGRGWECYPPEQVEKVRQALALLETSNPQ